GWLYQRARRDVLRGAPRSARSHAGNRRRDHRRHRAADALESRRRDGGRLFERPGPGEGRPRVMVYSNRVSRGHFRTLGIEVAAGRDFTRADRAGVPPIAIVNETLAARFWPGESPIGRRLRGWDGRQPTGPAIEVVGLVRDSKYVTVGEERRAFMYRPMSQEY